MVSYTSEVTDENFEDFIKNEYVLIDIFANWCGPCKNISPVIDKISSDYYKKVKVGKMDVDQNSKIPSKLGVRSIPTILIFKNGEEVERLVGTVSEEDITSLIDKMM
jgi:thioredoxin 1